MTKSYDVAIIGAVSAGLAALREVRKQTENVIIVQQALLKRTRLNSRKQRGGYLGVMESAN
jgi:pyruvate/2-oxoglutarate dehydrogenase complex dihydrolipoamide dehydrogenase (E3) component